jgi:hypothetical protein
MTTLHEVWREGALPGTTQLNDGLEERIRTTWNRSCPAAVTSGSDRSVA